MKLNKLAIIIPCYNEEEVLQVTSKRLLKIISNLSKKNLISRNSFLLFVNDGSKDNTWEFIKKLAKKNKQIKGISFSRNFGHQSALFAGYMYLKDIVDVTISIDADLQQDENAIPEFIKRYNEGYEIVNGVRTNRDTDKLFKKLSALLFYRLMKLMGVKIIENSADYRLISSKVLKELVKYGEVNLFLRGLIPTLGYKTTIVNHIVRERFAGKSKYSLKKMLILAFDGITSFSITPIRLITILGLLMSVISAVMILFVLTSWIFTRTVSGWASMLISIYFIGGIQLLCVGVIGEYIGKTYIETKRRPRYIIDDTI